MCDNYWPIIWICYDKLSHILKIVFEMTKLMVIILIAWNFRTMHHVQVAF